VLSIWAVSQSVAILPENPHYFLFKGKPSILTTPVYSIDIALRIKKFKIN
jgi:hypothetical protein